MPDTKENCHAELLIAGAIIFEANHQANTGDLMVEAQCLECLSNAHASRSFRCFPTNPGALASARGNNFVDYSLLPGSCDDILKNLIELEVFPD
ncbi:MAG: hypothetical protein OXF56_23685 [Rhodobacteraceae bacterium]|nr:hypothetical protein [Paracoccaceae bacterium]